MEKGLDLVIGTFCVLRDKGRDVRLSLAGPDNTGETEPMVEEALKSNRGLIERVGGVYRERQAKYFRSIDCFLFPSRTESRELWLTSQRAARTCPPSQD